MADSETQSQGSDSLSEAEREVTRQEDVPPSWLGYGWYLVRAAGTGVYNCESVMRLHDSIDSILSMMTASEHVYIIIGQDPCKCQALDCVYKGCVHCITASAPQDPL